MTTTPLTPEAVASLTDAELSEAVARVVLQAHVIRRWSQGGPEVLEADYYVGEGLNASVRTHINLSPERPESVFLVLEHMRQRWAKADVPRGWSISDLWADEGEPRLWWVSVVNPETPTEWAVTDESLGRCIFRMALLAAQEMEKEG